MKRILLVILSLVAAQGFAGQEARKTLDLNCKVSSQIGPEYNKRVKLVDGMLHAVPTQNDKIGSLINFNALHDYVTLEAWDTVSGAYAKTEAYQISITKKIYLQAADQNKKKLYFHFECEVE